MYEAMNAVSTCIHWPGKVIKYRNSEKSSRSEGQAQALYQLLEDMDIEGKIPQFLAGLTDMEVVQRALTNSALLSGDGLNASQVNNWVTVFMDYFKISFKCKLSTAKITLWS